MDAETKATIDKLVLDKAVHEAFVRKNLKALQEQIDIMLTMANNHQKLHESHTRSFVDLGRDFQRLNEVYYHIFPDRLEPDVRFEAQLRALRTDPNGKKGQP